MTLQWVSSDRMVKMRETFEIRYGNALRNRRHLWIATVCYFVTPPLTEGALLDVENMAMEPAVGCYICEELFTEQIARRRCTGEPR